MSRVASRENLEWVQEGSISVVSSIQDWVDEVVVDPDAGVEHLVNSVRHKRLLNGYWGMKMGAQIMKRATSKTIKTKKMNKIRTNNIQAL